VYARKISAVPADAAFKNVTVSVVQIGRDWLPDYNPDLLDRSLIRMQTAMAGKLRRKLDDVRERLDWPRGRSRRELGFHITKGEPSDVSLAAVLLVADSPFGIQYEWPDGLCLVLFRGHVYERYGDVLIALHDSDEEH
jgi:hypothetical protein